MFKSHPRSTEAAKYNRLNVVLFPNAVPATTVIELLFKNLSKQERVSSDCTHRGDGARGTSRGSMMPVS